MFFKGINCYYYVVGFFLKKPYILTIYFYRNIYVHMKHREKDLKTQGQDLPNQQQ